MPSISRFDRVYVHVPFTSTNGDNEPVELTEVDLALVPSGTDPVEADWDTVPVVNGKAKRLVHGPDGTPANGSIPVPEEGLDVYLKIVDGDEIQAVRVKTRITLQD